MKSTLLLTRLPGTNVSQTIGALDKAFNLIDEMARSGEDLGVTELANRLSLSKNQVFRILTTLKAHHYAYQTENKTYRLGTKFFEIGQQLLSKNDLLQLIQPLMDQLNDETGEAVHLFVRDGLQTVCVARRESRAVIGLSAQVGRRVLLHAGACPKAILAYQDPSFVDAVVAEYGLPVYTEHTIATREALDEELEEIRRRGYSESNEDVDSSACAIAIPIVGIDGQVNTAMSIAGPAQRFTVPYREHAFQLLVSARERLSASLGINAQPGGVSKALSNLKYVRGCRAEESSAIGAGKRG